MKKLILFLIILVLPVLLQSQDTLTSKQLRKILEGGQSGSNDKSSATYTEGCELLDHLILKSVSENVILLRHSYVLSKNKQDYKQKDKDYFGARSAIGFRIDGKIYTSLDVWNPWLNDPALKEFSKEYEPKPYTLECKSLKDSVLVLTKFNKYKLEKINDHVGAINDNKEMKGLQLSGSSDQQVLVIYYCKPDEDPMKAKIQMLVKYITPNWANGICNIEPPVGKKQILGGVLLNIKAASGIIEISAKGLYTEEEGKSKIILIASNELGGKTPGSKSKPIEIEPVKPEKAM